MPRSERRRWPRVGERDLEALAARVKPGLEVSVLNLSRGGLLLELSARLLPGASVVLQVGTVSSAAVPARGRVLRCNVSRVRAGDLRYRAAVQFDRELPVPVSSFLPSGSFGGGPDPGRGGEADTHVPGERSCHRTPRDEITGIRETP